MKNRRIRRRGFTLMEVLLVLAILVILGSFVTVGYVQLQRNANNDAARSQIAMLEDAVSFYTLAIGKIPDANDGLNALLAPPPSLKNPAKWAGPYIKEKQLPKDPWGNDYMYEVVNDTDGTFKIYSYGANGQQGDEDDIDPARDREQGIER